LTPGLSRRFNFLVQTGIPGPIWARELLLIYAPKHLGFEPAQFRRIPLKRTIPLLTALAIFTVALFLAGDALACANCGCDSKGHAKHSDHGKGHGGDKHAFCPLKVEGVTVQAQEPDGAVALAFSAGAEQLDELQTRVGKLAEMHNGHQGHPGMKGGMHADMPKATASVEQTDTGAVLVITPADPKDLDALRTLVKKQAEHMKMGHCPHQSKGDPS
jgi:hypothetical protein